MRRALRPRVCVPPPPRVAESRADTCAPRDVPRARSRPEGAGQEALQDARRGVARARRAAGPFAGGGGLCPPRAARNVGRAEGGQAALRLASAASRRRGGGCSVRDLNTARASCWWHSGGLRRSSPARPCGWACGAWSYRWWPARLQRGGTGTGWAGVARSYSYRWWRVRRSVPRVAELGGCVADEHVRERDDGRRRARAVGGACVCAMMDEVRSRGTEARATATVSCCERGRGATRATARESSFVSW